MFNKIKGPLMTTNTPNPPSRGCMVPFQSLSVQKRLHVQKGGSIENFEYPPNPDSTVNGLGQKIKNKPLVVAKVPT